jgi:hypothetical protein
MSAPVSVHHEKLARLEHLTVEHLPNALRKGKQFVAWRYEDRKGQP